MAKVVFPGLFPYSGVGNCDSYDSTNYTLSEALAMHWKVKKWEVSFSITWGDNNFSGTATATCDRASPDSGNAIGSVFDLVCYGGQVWDMSVDGDLQAGQVFFYPGNGPQIEISGFEFLDFRFPDDGGPFGERFPIDISFAGFSKTVDCVIYNEDIDSCTGSITATELFDYS